MHLHRFLIHGCGYGLNREGGAFFSTDARKVQLCDFGLRRLERFTYEALAKVRTRNCGTATFARWERFFVVEDRKFKHFFFLAHNRPGTAPDFV